MDIQAVYKKAVNQVLGSSMTAQQQRAAIDGLMDQKNQQLKILLSPLQWGMVIPTTERRSTWRVDSTANKTH